MPRYVINRLTQETNRALQEVAAENGYRWGRGEMPPRHTDHPCLVFYTESKKIFIGGSDANITYDVLVEILMGGEIDIDLYELKVQHASNYPTSTLCRLLGSFWVSGED